MDNKTYFKDKLPPIWEKYLDGYIDKELLNNTLSNLQEMRQKDLIFPPEGMIFSAFNLTNPQDVKVIIVGQDPYHDDNQACGLAFGVQNGCKIPPSLRNIYKELKSDLGIEITPTGNLTPWAKNGVLLLNTVLSVQAHKANSHQKILNWEIFTDQVIKALSEKKTKICFILWGNPAQKKEDIICNKNNHLIIKGVHPSPLSASRGFFGSKPFSQAEAFLGLPIWSSLKEPTLF
jgi:uracil-DNA glycosylase